MLSGYVGGTYSSNLTRFTKLYRVIVQASPEFRLDEQALSNTYQQALRSVRRLLDLNISLHNYDWHGNMKKLGAERNTEALWAAVAPAVQATGASAGRRRARGAFFLYSAGQSG